MASSTNGSSADGTAPEPTTTPSAPLDVTALPSEMTERAREIWLAGLGAWARASEEGEKVFHTLVERGAAFETRRRDQLDQATHVIADQQKRVTDEVAKVTERMTQTLNDTAKTVEKAVSDTFTATMSQVGLPTRTEVRTLSSKVDQLSSKLDALSALLDAEAPSADVPDAVAKTDTVYHVAPHDDGWAVTREGAEQASSVHGTKKEALAAGRDLARSQAPSELIVHKMDRSVQETFAYGEEDSA